MKIAVVLLAGSFSLFTVSCADINGLTKGQQGALGGAAGGALIGQAIGHDTKATLIGAAVGTMVGYIVGNEMDKFDRQQLNYAYEGGRSGQAYGWSNPDNGNNYQVVPQPAYTNPRSRQICRQAEITAIIDGHPQSTYTTACRDDYGQWNLST